MPNERAGAAKQAERTKKNKKQEKPRVIFGYNLGMSGPEVVESRDVIEGCVLTQEQEGRPIATGVWG